METRQCPVCRTENESQYAFCKNCGAPLNDGAGASQTATEIFSPKTPDSGISREDFATYIGPNAEPILKNFDKMQVSGQKISWCWPAAILGFLMGPCGAALWFFYRKIYKVAWIFLLLGLLLTAANIWTIFAALQSVPQYLEVQSQAQWLELLSEAMEHSGELISAVERLMRVAIGVLGGLLGYYWYRESAARRIFDFRRRNTDARYDAIGLTALGGRSGGMLAVGILLMYVVPVVLCSAGLFVRMLA